MADDLWSYVVIETHCPRAILYNNTHYQLSVGTNVQIPAKFGLKMQNFVLSNISSMHNHVDPYLANNQSIMKLELDFWNEPV